jgi:hypothetical protein
MAEATPAKDPKVEAELQKQLAEKTQAALDARKKEYDDALTDSAETDDTVVGKVKSKAVVPKVKEQPAPSQGGAPTHEDSRKRK